MTPAPGSRGGTEADRPRASTPVHKKGSHRLGVATLGLALVAYAAVAPMLLSERWGWNTVSDWLSLASIAAAVLGPASYVLARTRGCRSWQNRVGLSLVVLWWLWSAAAFVALAFVA